MSSLQGCRTGTLSLAALQVGPPIGVAVLIIFSQGYLHSSIATLSRAAPYPSRSVLRRAQSLLIPALLVHFGAELSNIMKGVTQQNTTVEVLILWK